MINRIISTKATSYANRKEEDRFKMKDMKEKSFNKQNGEYEITSDCEKEQHFPHFKVACPICLVLEKRQHTTILNKIFKKKCSTKIHNL